MTATSRVGSLIIIDALS